MYYLTKELNFCAAHRLQRHRGKCRFIHGHNYRVLLTLSASLQEDGMVLDFSVIKTIAQKFLDDHYDHRLILEMTDPLLPLLQRELPDEQALNIHVFPSAPTAENMAGYFTGHFINLFLDYPVRVVGVEVFETPTSSAVYKEEQRNYLEPDGGN